MYNIIVSIFLVLTIATFVTFFYFCDYLRKETMATMCFIVSYMYLSIYSALMIPILNSEEIKEAEIFRENGAEFIKIKSSKININDRFKRSFHGIDKITIKREKMLPYWTLEKS